MGAQTDVLSAVATADGTMVSGRNRLKGVVMTATTTAGSVVFKDGGSSGTTRLRSEEHTSELQSH